jgi:RNA 2',3'-cyclic 3'-phosphodiesterase
MARLFFALWPDDDVRLRLARHAVELAREAHGRATRAESLHMTLSFLGEIPDKRVPDLAACAQSVFSRPFNFELNRAACFPRAKVAWLGSTEPPQELFDLQAILQAELVAADFQVDSRPFMPHITVARGVEIGLPVRDIPPILWAARSFCLVKSAPENSGVHYEVVNTWKL